MDSVSRRMFRIAAFTFALGCLPAAVQAQTNLAASYRFERYSGDRERRSYPLGLQIAAEQVLGRGTWSVVGGLDFAARSWDTPIPPIGISRATNRHSAQQTYSFGAGLRFAHALTRRTLRWHAQIVGGAARRNYSDLNEPGSFEKTRFIDTEPFLEVAGGISRRLTADVSLIGQAGYRRSFDRDPKTAFAFFFGSVLQDADVFHFSVGVRFPLVPRGR